MWDFPPVSEQENRSKLFLGIDQHARQLTVSLRDQNCDVTLACQVSTQPEKVLEFFDQLTRSCAQRAESFIAVLEVCGFNDWLIRMLQDWVRPAAKTDGPFDSGCKFNWTIRWAVKVLDHFRFAVGDHRFDIEMRRPLRQSIFGGRQRRLGEEVSCRGRTCPECVRLPLISMKE